MKSSFKLSILLLLIIVFAACEFDYQSARASRISNRVYIAERVVNTKSGISTAFTNNSKQMLIFSGDTMRVVRNDTLIEQLINYHTAGLLGKEKDGKFFIEGYSKEGAKIVLIELKDPKNSAGGDIILSPLIIGAYNEKNDTIKTYYRPCP